MSNRVRVISQVEALYASTATSGTQTINQLHRVQSCNYGGAVNRQDVLQFGELAPIARLINESPTVNLDFSYYATNLLNEYNLGFVVDGSTSAISGVLNGTSDSKNFYLLTVPEGTDAVGYTGTAGVTYGIGNGFMDSYSVEAAVGGFPTASVKVQGLNLRGYAASTGQTPAINPVDGSRLVDTFTIPTAVSGVVGQVPAIQQGGVSLSIGSSEVGVDLTSMNIQKFTLTVPLSRELLQRLGNRFAFTRVLTFPIKPTLTVDANLSEIAEGGLDTLLCNDPERDLVITLYKTTCSGNGAVAAQYTLKGAKYDSHNFTSSVGNASKSVSISYSCNVGGPLDAQHNIIFSGSLV